MHSGKPINAIGDEATNPKSGSHAMNPNLEQFKERIIKNCREEVKVPLHLPYETLADAQSLTEIVVLLGLGTYDEDGKRLTETNKLWIIQGALKGLKIVATPPA